MSDTFNYTCERCGDLVRLSRGEYDNRVTAARTRKRRRGAPVGTIVVCEGCEAVKVAVISRPVKAKPKSRGSLQPAASLSLTPRERGLYGVTATLRNRVNGKEETVARSGASKAALMQIVREVDAADGDWKIVTLSTPRTIFRDLQGAHDTERVLSTENRLLTMVGRMDLAETQSQGRRR